MSRAGIRDGDAPDEIQTPSPDEIQTPSPRPQPTASFGFVLVCCLILEPPPAETGQAGRTTALRLRALIFPPHQTMSTNNKADWLSLIQVLWKKQR